MVKIHKGYINYIVYGLVVVLLILLLPSWVWYIILIALLGALAFLLHKLRVFDKFFH